MNLISPQPELLLLSLDEQRNASCYLASTRDKLLEVVSGLSDIQWRFKPAPNRWSTAEVLEHLVLIEQRVHGLVASMPNAPEPESSHVNSQVEEAIRALVPQRLTKFHAPPHVSPTGQLTPEEAKQRFLELRERTLNLLTAAPALRGHVVPHPFLGPWDGYQWILAAAAHTARHTDQILECKAHPEFPEMGGVSESRP